MEWKDKISTFKQIDVRGIQGNFFQGLKKQAMTDHPLSTMAMSTICSSDFWKRS